jgi:two-component system chemotaxis response regulator CheB
MSAYRVLVVDDSIFMRQMITDLIQEDDRFTVLDTAKNGKEAVYKTMTQKPDIITMDIDMPVMNGLEALKLIMAENPTPVIMLSSLTAEGTRETIEALEAGAVDFVHKPSGSISFDLHKEKKNLHDRLLSAVQSKVKYSPPPLAGKRTVTRTLPLPDTSGGLTGTSAAGAALIEHLVAIGISTGGPRALHYVLTSLPRTFSAPILIVQHMPPGFTKSLADRLNTASDITVVEAEEGMVLRGGTAYIAPGGKHMTAYRQGKVYRLRLTVEAPRSGHRPSVDMMFDSLVPLKELKRHIVLMTGMGSDGAMGMLALKHGGAVTTIAESEETCVVYGMPRAAVEQGGAMHILPQHEIPEKLIELVMK